MRNKYLIIVPLLFCFSCTEKSNRKKEIENYLTGGSDKYWTLMEGGNIKRNQGVLYKSNGTYVDYYVKDFKEVGVKFFSNNYEKPIWEIKDNDTLHISGFINLKYSTLLFDNCG